MRKRWFWILALALLAYVVKSVFVGADIDEAYGVTVGYRLVQGDRLMWDMWEPHQTSAVFTAFFIRLILLFTRGSLDFLTVFLRISFFVVQAGIACYLYRTFRSCLPELDKEECILFAMVYFLTTPKCIYVPEYSNLHMWFSTLLALFLMQYFCRGSAGFGKRRYLILAGSMLACDVLAYPSMVIFYPVCLVVLWRHAQDRKKRWRECIWFTAPCVLGACLFTGYLFSYMRLQDMKTVIPCILVDGSHQFSVWEKLLLWGSGFWEIGLMTLGCGLAAIVFLYLCRKKCRIQNRPMAFLITWFLVQTIFQVAYWFHSDYNSGYPQLAYAMVALFGLYAYHGSAQKSKTALYLIGMGALNFVGLNLFSNWKPTSLTVYLVLGLIGGFLCWRNYFCEKASEKTGVKWMKILLVVFILSEAFGRCLLMIGSDDSAMITEVRGISKKGVRGGIFTSYMNSYRYNNNYELFPEIVPAGSNVLYLGPSQFYYMLGDCRVASPSTISTPEFDENLKLYYELHPERFPDLVVMESCYGDVSYFSPDDYIYTWLEEEFAPAQVTDYPYVRVYRREQQQ